MNDPEQLKKNIFDAVRKGFDNTANWSEFSWLYQNQINRSDNNNAFEAQLEEQLTTNQ